MGFKMQHYVLVHADTGGYNFDSKKVLLVLKNKPSWQKNRLNLIGGKVEPGEDYTVAAYREFLEETGITCYSMKYMGLLSGDDYNVHCFKTQVAEDAVLQPREAETELVAWYNWKNIVNDERLLPNLRVIIPMMDMDIANWEINYHNNIDGHDKYSYEIKMMLSNKN